jgi:hypothetical protein
MKNRKPDVETESFRMWKLTDKEKAIDKKKTKDEPTINYLGEKVTLLGFNYVKSKSKKGKLILAYKVKPEDKLVLYYIGKKLIAKEKEFVANFFEKASNYLDDFEFQNLDEAFKGMENEKHLFKTK